MAYSKVTSKYKRYLNKTNHYTLLQFGSSRQKCPQTHTNDYNRKMLHTTICKHFLTHIYIHIPTLILQNILMDPKQFQMFLIALNDLTKQIDEQDQEIA